MTTLEVHIEQLSLKGNVLIEALHFTLKAGKIVTLMGPSGCGKSTILNYIAGFWASDFKIKGKLLLNGKDLAKVPAHKRGMGLLLQDPLLFPHFNLGQNIRFAAKDILSNEALDSALAQIELKGMAAHDPALLSGGQKARAALLRTLVNKPRALLLDEPFSKLDKSLRARIRTLVFAQSWNLPMLLVTHDDEDAKAAAGEVINLEEFIVCV